MVCLGEKTLSHHSADHPVRKLLQRHRFVTQFCFPDAERCSRESHQQQSQLPSMQGWKSAGVLSPDDHWLCHTVWIWFFFFFYDTITHCNLWYNSHFNTAQVKFISLYQITDYILSAQDSGSSHLQFCTFYCYVERWENNYPRCMAHDSLLDVCRLHRDHWRKAHQKPETETAFHISAQTGFCFWETKVQTSIPFAESKQSNKG